MMPGKMFRSAVLVCVLLSKIVRNGVLTHSVTKMPLGMGNL
jgi:hypothetical protein